MKTTRLLVTLIASLFCLCKSALAQEDNREAYAVCNGNTLTFYYDNDKSTRNGSKYSIPWNTNYQPGWYIYRDGITTVVFDDSFSNYHELTSTANMFYELNDLTTIEGIENLKTENVTDMSYMFYNCFRLESLTLSSFNTSNVTNMSNMFSGCNKLNSLNVSSFNTSKVTDMSDMFSSCYKLNSLNVSSFNTEMVENMSNMFSYSRNLNSLDLSNFNTSNVKYMTSMFEECNNLTSLTLSPLFKTPNVERMTNMFYNCFALESLDLSSFETTNVKYMDCMFYNCSSLTELDLSSFYTNAIILMTSMFSGCDNLESVDIRNFSTSNSTTATTYMFGGCSKLTEIICLNAFEGENLNSTNMFINCDYLKGSNGTVFDSNKVNGSYAHPDGGPSNPGYFTDGKPYAILSGGTLTFYYDLEKDNRTGTDFDFPTKNKAPKWTTSEYASTITTVTFDESFLKYTGLTSPKILFSGLSSLTTISNLNYLNTDYVTDMSYMFSGCSGLTILNLSGLNTENVTDMSHMFEDCSSLTKINLSGLDTENVTDISYMFKGCSGLTNIELPNINSEDYDSEYHLTNTSHLFDGCRSLTSIDVSKISTEYVTDMSYMFSGCSSLTSLDVSSFDVDNVTNMTKMFSGCSSLATIYCNNDWSDGNVSSSDNMFTGCPFVQDNNVTVDFAKPSADGGYFSAPPMAYAYLNNHKLIFRYDDNYINLDYALELQENEQYYLGEYFGNNVIQVIFEQSFSDFMPTTTANWFAGMRYLESITGLEYLNTEAVTDMNSMFYGCEKLTSLDLTSFDVSNVTDMGTMFAYCNSLEMIYAGNWYDILHEKEVYSSGMFAGCWNLPNWDENNSNNIDFAKPSENGGYFSSRRVYAIISNNNLSFHFDGKNTDKVTYDIDWNIEDSWKDATLETFENENFDVTFDPSFADYKLTSTAGMFSGMTGLTTINGLDNLNTSSITDMSNMFNGCTGLTTIYCGKDWSGLSVPSTDMFAGCTSLVGAISYDNNKTDITYANPYDGYFSQLPQAYAVQEGSVLTFYYDNRINTHSDAIIYEIPWEEGGIEGGEEGSGGGYPGWINFGDEEGGGLAPARKSAKARTANEPITLVVFDRSFKNYHGLNSTTNMFYRMGSLTSIEGLENLNTENVTTMQSMFEGCSRLTSIDLTSFNTEKVSTMESLFRGCSRLTSIDLTSFNTESVTTMESIFRECSSLTSLDLTSFNTEKVSTFHAMFEGCSSLTSLNLSNFNTGQAYQLWSMFRGCSNLTTLDLTNFDMTKVTDVDEVFYNCSSLETIFCNVDWSSKSYEYSSDIFWNCVSLKGSNGTTYDDYDRYNSISFAHPDGGEDDPGFFTPLSDDDILLYDSRSNTETISNSNGESVKVYLADRTLYKTGDWNTLCLPFSFGNEDNGLTGTPLEGATVMTLDNSENSETGFDPSSGILTLNFVEENYIEAGKPYIIKWENSGENIVNPTFTGVTISSTLSPVVAPCVTFMGTYDPQPLTSANSNILYLGAGNTLYYPSADMTINAFRAYFELNLTSGQQVKAINLNFGDEEAASIKTISESSDHSKSSDTYFSLDGLRLLEKPTQKGMYINNGRKVLIK